MLREPAESNGFWLKLSKIGALETTISKDEAIEAALCWDGSTVNSRSSMSTTSSSE